MLVGTIHARLKVPVTDLGGLIYQRGEIVEIMRVPGMNTLSVVGAQMAPVTEMEFEPVLLESDYEALLAWGTHKK